jgi:S-adenosylmethionine uptake transporter
MLFIIAAYRRAEAVVVAPMQYSQMIWAAIYGALIFDESLDVYTVVGSAIIIASGIYIVVREGTKRVSTNTPVLRTQARPETGLLPRVSSLMGIGGRHGDPRVRQDEGAAGK